MICDSCITSLPCGLEGEEVMQGVLTQKSQALSCSVASESSKSLGPCGADGDCGTSLES